MGKPRIALCSLIISAMTLICGCDEVKEASVNSESDIPSASPKGSQLSLRGVCTFKPSRVVRLKAQVGGRVKSVYSERGSWVKSDMVMATIDITELELKKQRIRLELEKLRARAEFLNFQITKAEKEFSVVESLTGGATQYLPRYGKEMAALVERRADLKDNQLSQSLSELDIKTVDELIKKSTILAPFDGVVLSRAVEPGMVIGSGIDGISGGDVLFDVADPRHLFAECFVKEADALSAKQGIEVDLVPDGEGTSTIKGRISHMSPVITNVGGVSRREFQVEIYPSHNTALLPGMSAEVVIPSVNKN